MPIVNYFKKTAPLNLKSIAFFKKELYSQSQKIKHTMKNTVLGLSHEYLSELEKTQQIIAALPDDKKDWKPHSKSMSLGELASHVVELQTWFNNAIEENVYDLQTDYKPLEFDNFSHLNTILAQGVKRNLEAMNQKEKEFWLEEFTFKKGTYVITKLPRIAFIRSVLTNHFIHHRGQLSVYLRLLDIPVPGIYGPSADEN